MQISELARRSGVPARTIRYYESVRLLPAPTRADNNERHYDLAALDRLRFIINARSLGFALADIGELLTARDARDAPCQRVLDVLDTQLATLDQRIADLLALRGDLQHPRAEGERRPLDQGASGQKKRFTPVQELSWYHALMKIAVG